MLAKMISETWEKDPENPLFIDRDSDLFAQVLNYLRYGSIELPFTITQAMFQRELDYYAIPATDGSVTQEKKKTLAQIADDIRQQDMNHKIFYLAVECYHRFYKNFASSGVSGVGSVRFSLAEKDGELYTNFGRTGFREDMVVILENFLNDCFGLSVDITRHNCLNTFGISVKNWYPALPVRLMQKK